MSTHPDLSEALKKRQQIDRYSRWMYNTFKKYIGKRVLDIGSGTGNMIDFFIDDCDKIVATDIFPDQVDYIKERFKDRKNIESRYFDIGSNNIGELLDYNFDTITCINVLEHIEHDLDALAAMKQMIAKGGNIIILVPAFGFLYGTMDKKCGHYRRYNRRVLKSMAEKLNLTVLENRYFNSLGILPWYIKGRVLKKEGTFSDTLNSNNSKVYNLASCLMEPVEKRIRIPLGISEIIVLRK